MSDFLQILEQYRGNKIALYGLGTETERVLAQLDDDIRVVGLLDGYREEGELYGKKIIPLTQAVELGVKLILVVARPGSCRAIAKRIGGVCIKNQIALFDVRGRDLCDEKKAIYDFKDVEGVTKKHLIKLIEEKNVLSVDLFDTLIMRKVLFPSDVYELVEAKLIEQGIFIDNFCVKRLDSEKYLAKIMSPTLEEIYKYMVETYSINNVTSSELAEIEWKIDFDLVICRQEVCKIISDFYNQGKEIYIVSDTYYTAEQLAQLLEKCNITFYTDILSSCDYNTGKPQMLFYKLKEKVGEKSCIHIGDDLFADIESAEHAGLTACRIYSGIDLLEQVGYLGLWECIDNLSDRVKVGLIVSNLFNSPFQFETQDKKITIANSWNIAYLFFASMISDFVLWFEKKVKYNQIENIWFCARDGYLIKKMYDELKTEEKSVYFLTSRTAALRAGIQNEDDIRYVEDMKFCGTISEELLERFGIIAGEERTDLLKYSGEILEKASVCRKGYKKYINSLGLQDGNIAFFDFVAKGTCQMYISHLIDNHLKGLYFLQLDEDYMKAKELDIDSFYEKDEKEKSEIFDNYYILETVLTSPMPSVREFDNNGNACYATETRKEVDFKYLEEAQDGVLSFFKTYLNICPEFKRTENKKLDEILLSLIHRVKISDENFLKLKVEDSFFNRMTDMSSLV